MAELSTWLSGQLQAPYVLKTPKDAWGTWEPNNTEIRSNEQWEKARMEDLEKLKDVERVERTLIEGDPKVGTIYILAQTHIPSNFGSRLTETKKLVAKYQYQIAREILTKNLKQVWTEALDLEIGEKFNNVQKDPSLLFAKYPALLEFNTNQLPEQASALALQTIEKFKFGEQVVAFPHPEITLHSGQANHEPKTLNQMCGTAAELLGVFGILTSCARADIIRERWVVERLYEYLHEHPSERIGLVYGSDHEFTDDIRLVFGNTLPKVVEIIFPKLTQEADTMKSLELSGQIGKDEEYPHIR